MTQKRMSFSVIVTHDVIVALGGYNGAHLNRYWFLSVQNWRIAYWLSRIYNACVTSLQVKRPVPVLMMSSSDLANGSCFFLTATFFKISKIQNRLLWLDVVRCSVECEVVFLQNYRFVACSKSSVLIYVEVAGTCSNDKSRVSCLDGFSWPRLSQLISFGNSCVSFDCYVQSELRHRDVNTSSCS